MYKITVLLKEPEGESDKHIREWIKADLMFGKISDDNPLEFACIQDYVENVFIVKEGWERR